MSDPVRVTVTDDGETRSVRVHDDAGTVEVGPVSFSFSVGGTADDQGDEDTPADDGDRDPLYIAPLSAVPVHGTMRCEGLSDRRGVEFICRREGDEVVAWRNSCPHEPDVPLDRGTGAIVTDLHLVCHKHGARFVRGEGLCSSGPCQGAALAPIDVSVRDGDVYLTDGRFDACRVF